MIRSATAGLLTAVLLAPQPAAAAAGAWKVKLRIPGQVLVSDLVAGSGGSAWLVGNRTDGRQASYFFDGRRWRSAPLPEGAHVAGLPGMPPSLAASSAGAWALSQADYRYEDEPGDDQADPCAADPAAGRRAAAGSGIEIKRPAKLLRWKNGRWVGARTFKDVAVQTIAARGEEVFAFGLTRAGKSVMLRFSGGRWRTARLPLHVWEARVTGRNVWVQGFGLKDGSQQVRRFDGVKWHDTRLGRALPADLQPTGNRPGRSTMVTSMAVSNGGRASVSGYITRDRLCPGDETEFAKAEPFLLRFKNGTWRKVPLKGMKGLQINEHVPDGRGGFYAVADTAFGHDGDVSAIMRGTSGGAWTREKLPQGRPIGTLTAIPGGGHWAVTLTGGSTLVLRR